MFLCTDMVLTQVTIIMKKHQVNALYALGGTIFGFLLTYFLISYTVSKRTEHAYFKGFDEGYTKGYSVGYKIGFNTCYDEAKVYIDSVSVKLTTLSILLKNN